MDVAVRQSGSTSALDSDTGDQGEFRIAAAAAGGYRIEVSAEGFLPLTAQGTLRSQAAPASLDLTLEVGDRTENVEVIADALAAETTSTQLGQAPDTKKIEAVPLNGRNFTDLMAVQSGIAPVNTAQPGAVVMTGVASTPPSGDANPVNPSLSRALSAFDLRHNLVASFRYQVPESKQKGLLHTMTSGWALAGITRFYLRPPGHACSTTTTPRS